MNDLEQQIIDLYNSGIGADTIGKQLNINRNKVYTVLKKFNIPRRNNKTKGRRYTHNHNYFETIDTEHKAYWLGFFYADGFVNSNKDHPNGFGISISETDRGHLEKFKLDIEATNPINTYTQTSGYSNNSKYCRLIMTSEKTKNDLIDKGVLEHKTDILQFPTMEQVPMELIHHFIRGYFDGDGCLSYTNTDTNKNYYKVKILGTDDFLDGINEFLINKNIANIKHYFKRKEYQAVSSMELNETQSLNLLNCLYQDATISLDRKYNRYCNLCEKHHVEPNGNIRC